MEKAKITLLSMQRYPWEHGTAMQAFLEAGDMDVVIPMAYEAAYRAAEDGRPAQIGEPAAVTDPCSTGEGLLAAYQATKDPYLKKAADKLLKWALYDAPRSSKGIVYHLVSEPQIWSDSLYMLPPYLAAAGEYEECLKQLYGYLDALMDKETYLIRHIWDEEKQEFTHAAFWGGGIGWTVAGIARVIDLLPAEYAAQKQDLIRLEEKILDSMQNYLREDGFFHDILDDPESFVETNCGQMAAYAIYRGVSSGWLPEDYLKMADKMRKAAKTKMDACGRIWDACGAPTFDKPGSSPEANAFYILMEVMAAKCGR